MNNEKNNSVKRDWMIAGGAAAGFFGILKAAGYVEENFDISGLFNFVDFSAIALKVALASALVWSVQKFIFSNTLGKDFGTTFDFGWNSMNPVEKTRWTIGVFVILFSVIISTM